MAKSWTLRTSAERQGNRINCIVCAALLSGMNDWNKIEAFAFRKEDWLRRYCELPNGIPSIDTMSHVLGRIKPQAFAACVAQ